MIYAVYSDTLEIREDDGSSIQAGAKKVTGEFISMIKGLPVPTSNEIRAAFDALQPAV